MADDRNEELDIAAIARAVQVDILAMDRRMAEVDALLEHWRLDGVPEHDRLATLFSVAVHLAHEFGMNKAELGELVGELHDSLMEETGGERSAGSAAGSSEDRAEYCVPLVTATAKASLS